ncbi:D-alanyl-D-alanine carboxypeptidase [Streptomyces sp. SAI-229]|uniref:D-alanyl-D-alanine carboxypeptidase n=1 Tax=Streptomyces sp. SAI-229 TaxID=3377731 RepID=UPI003C7ED313
MRRRPPGRARSPAACARRWPRGSARRTRTSPGPGTAPRAPLTRRRTLPGGRTPPEAGTTASTAGADAEGTSDRTAAADDREDASEAGTPTRTADDQGERETEPESGRTDDASGKAEDASGRTADATKPKGGAEDAADGSETSRAEDEPGSAPHAVAGTGTDADAESTAVASRDQDEPGSAGTDAAPESAVSAQDAPRAGKKPGNAGADPDAPEAVVSAGDEDTGKAAGDAPRDRDGSEETGQDAPGAGAAEAAALAGSGEEDSEAGSSEGGDGKPAAKAPGAVDDASDEDGEDSEDDRRGKDEPGDGPAAGTPKAGAAGEDGRPKAEGPVDQPTAVFRTGRPSAPAVDQPTTMLKLGGAGREAAAEAERTSKFVALKRDEDLGGRKPPIAPAAPAAPAGATSALPQVGPERTTQQPLPPRPPLDLLAELTNTPPPPQTPLRTAVRRVKIWAPLVVLLAIVFAIVQAVRPLPAPTLALTAEDTHTFDGDPVKLPWPGEGQGWMSGDGIGTMDHFGEQEPVAIGSVAKTMTAYIILREHPLKPGEEGPKIEVDAKAEKEGGYDKDGESTLNTVKAGDFLTEKQALSAVMIPSANNIARLLARWDAGSEEAFVKKMNDTAKELGMTNTTYTDPSGLKETTVSTAEDQTKLGIVAMRNPAMVAITSAASWTDPSGQYWSNYNELPYTMGAIGIKTGSTTKAGGNLLFAARKEVDGRSVIVVGAILGQHKSPILTTVNDVSKPALRAAQDALTSTEILKKGTVVGYADDGLGGRTPVAVTEDVKAVGWAGLEVKLTFAGGDLPHTAKAGTKVGTLTVGDGSSGAVKVPVALQEDLVEPGFMAKLTRLS